MYELVVCVQFFFVLLGFFYIFSFHYCPSSSGLSVL